MTSLTRIDITPTDHVTAIAYPAPPRKRAGICLLLAHGAGGSQASPFMVAFASGLAARGIDAVTFNFVYSEQGRKLPDRSDRLEACYRQAIAAVRAGALGKTIARDGLAIGGKSMGGRIASQLAAADAEGVSSLVLLGYPLHPPGRPKKPRTAHLAAIRIPVLIVQGERDAFGTPAELRPILRTLKAPSELHVVDAGDHSFKVPKRTGTPQEQVYAQVLDEIVRWLRAVKK
jgi:uncharacterized protein